MTRVPWRELTLVDLVGRQAVEQGDRPFVRFEDGQAFSFRLLDAWTDELAKTPTGKLQKTPLREAGVTAPTWDRDSVGYVVRR
jgi:acyl-CoA synthetase (AMP-forming)/AMP-acid ligase II